MVYGDFWANSGQSAAVVAHEGTNPSLCDQTAMHVLESFAVQRLVEKGQMPVCGKWQCAVPPATGREPARSHNWNTPGLDDVLPALFNLYAKEGLLVRVMGNTSFRCVNLSSTSAYSPHRHSTLQMGNGYLASFAHHFHHFMMLTENDGERMVR
jgi:hypothetical protein